MIDATDRAENTSERVRELEGQRHTVKLEVEVDKLREVDSVCREFTVERRQMREDHEQDAAHFETLTEKIVAENDKLS